MRASGALVFSLEPNLLKFLQGGGFELLTRDLEVGGGFEGGREILPKNIGGVRGLAFQNYLFKITVMLTFKCPDCQQKITAELEEGNTTECENCGCEILVTSTEPVQVEPLDEDK